MLFAARSPHSSACFVMSFALIGCGAPPDADAGPDATAAVDGGAAVDGAVGDAGTGDSGTGDSGTGDSGTGDSGAGDSGTGDSGAGDAGFDAGAHFVDAGSGPRLEVVSTRPDTVSGGDVLVRASGTGALTLQLDDVDVSDALRPDGGAFLARVQGLPLGPSTLRLTDDVGTTELPIVNHPITGPIFSGPHQEPFTCTTEEFLLGQPMDMDCTGAPLVAHWYRNTGGEFRILRDPTARPADVAQTTTLAGTTHDYIVRIEVGTINRAIFFVSSLFDPSAPAWEPWQKNPAWNDRVVYVFGGGCGPGHWQGTPNYELALNDGLLGRGYAVLHSSLNTLGNNCNDVLSAETALMVKEHFIERYGEPRYTIGFGGSGGSIQQHQIADNYPGVLDGIQPGFSYPDVWGVFYEVEDCHLMRQAFAARPGVFASAEVRRAVTGFGSEATCTNWDNTFSALARPGEGCNPRVPAEQIYHPVNNPTGVRCTLADHNVNLIGRDPETGFARRVYDNRGVQYGLGALLAGEITAEQFVVLNEQVGGLDVDGARSPARSIADPEAVRRLYAGGRILDATQGLPELPIVDTRIYGDPTGDIHDAFRTFSTRDRLTRSGDADNQVAFFTEPAGGAYPAAVLDSFDVMDEWLTALAADADPDRAAATRRARPAGLDDRCYETATPRAGLCPETFTTFESPRLVAGAPRSNDIPQCALRPFDASDYGGRLSAPQLTRLEAVFPDGVCDWSAPPPNRVPHAGVWQSY